MLVVMDASPVFATKIGIHTSMPTDYINFCVIRTSNVGGVGSGEKIYSGG